LYKQREPKREATKHSNTYPLRAQAIEHHFTSRATSAQLTGHQQTSNITTQSVRSQQQHKTAPNITMTRINISYLIALGLLGTAVACKYFAFSRNTNTNSGDKRKNKNTH